MIFESMAYFAPLDGAAWWASSRMSSEPGRKSPSQSRSVAGVGLVDQQAVRDEEPRVGRPRVDAVAALLPDPRRRSPCRGPRRPGRTASSSSSCHCRQHRRRAGDDDVLDLLAQQQLAGDQPGLDRLAEADVVGDEQVDAGQQQGLAERLELVGVDAGCRPGTGTGRGSGRSRSRSSSAACAGRRRKPRRVEAPAGDRPARPRP